MPIRRHGRLFVLQRREHVEPGSATRGQQRSQHAGDHGDGREGRQLCGRDVEGHSLAGECAGQDPGQEEPSGNPSAAPISAVMMLS